MCTHEHEMETRSRDSSALKDALGGQDSLKGALSSRNDTMAPVEALYVTKPVSPLGPGPRAMYLQ